MDEPIGKLREKMGPKAGLFLFGTIMGRSVIIFRSKQDDTWTVYPGKGKPEGYKNPFEGEPGDDVPF
jgi:hypothetical protein